MLKTVVVACGVCVVAVDMSPEWQQQQKENLSLLLLLLFLSLKLSRT